MTPKKRDDWFGLLPPLASPEEAAATPPGAPGDWSAAPPRRVTLTDAEFRDALRGEVSPPPSALSAPASAKAAAAAAGAAGPGARAAAAAFAPTASDLPPVSSATVAATGSPEISDEVLAGYAEAAALRYTYRLDALTPLVPGQELPPGDLRYKALRPQARDAVFAYLTGRSEIVADASGSARWMLRDDERRAALLRLIVRGAAPPAIAQARADAEAEARVGAPAPSPQPAPVGPPKVDAEPSLANRVEETLWQCLSGQAPPLAAQDRRQLLITQRVDGWLYELTSAVSVPSPELVTQQLARETLLQPFRHLTGEWRDGSFVSNFTGREEELTRLYDYLAVLPPKSFSRRLGRAAQGLADAAWRLISGSAGYRPCLIHGPGGAGKSTLLAKLLLDHMTETPAEDRFPYAYLDFDLSALSAREPLTLLAEAARQLGAQYPTSADEWTAARTDWLQSISNAGPFGVHPEARASALERFSKTLGGSGSGNVAVAAQFARRLPFLLVLDTFEEVQYHDRDAIRDVFRFLNALREQVPALRVIMMGRAPLSDVQSEYRDLESVAIESDSFGTGLATNFDVIEVQLGDLGQDAAHEYLSRQGVADSSLAEELVEVVGSNPLTLRLIASLLRDRQVDLTSLRQEMEWRPSLAAWLRGRKIPPKALLQGFLFRRILGHIHDPKTRDLAHPGLILRRITPDLIKEVLAEPCGLGKLDDPQALSLFWDLAREVSLVGADPSSLYEAPVIRHRPELRRIMLRLMEADEEKKDQIQQVNENAVRYYQARQGQAAREEELYHRLMVCDLPRPEVLADDVPTEEAVDAGFVAAPRSDEDLRLVWRDLTASLDELPATAGTYLAARVNRELVADAEWEAADPGDWELMILGRASRRARERGSVISALLKLQQDRERMRQRGAKVPAASPLPLIEVALLLRLQRHEEAIGLGGEQLALLKGPPRRLAEYGLLTARAAASLGDSRRCVQALSEAVDAVGGQWGTSPAELAASRRCLRQLLRFAADCYLLSPSRGIFGILAKSLMGLRSEKDALSDHPALARHAVSAAVSSPPESPSAYADLLDGVKASLLPVLLDRPPAATVARLSEALAAWSAEALASGADGMPSDAAPPARVFAAVLKLPAPPSQLDRWQWQDAWRRLWQDPAGQASTGPAAQVSRLFAAVPISPASLAAVYLALRPEPAAGQAGEDPVAEARRAGDLIAGEAPASAAPATSEAEPIA